MTIKSDIEIAQEARPLPITAIAEACGVDEAYLEMEKYLWTYFLNNREGSFSDGRHYHIVATDFIENKNKINR